jgi:hypothetical protein
MTALALKVTGDELIDRIAGLVGPESGTVTGSPLTEGKQYYCAIFPSWGEVTWIPAECCTITED